MVSAAVTVAMASADNSGNGEAGNGGGNRGSSRATTINQHTAAAVAKTEVLAGAMDVAALAAVETSVASKVHRQGQIVALAAMVIDYSKGGAVPRMDPNLQQTSTFWSL